MPRLGREGAEQPLSLFLALLRARFDHSEHDGANEKNDTDDREPDEAFEHEPHDGENRPEDEENNDDCPHAADVTPVGGR